jgi:hypothetical protein
MIIKEDQWVMVRAVTAQDGIKCCAIYKVVDFGILGFLLGYR